MLTGFNFIAPFFITSDVYIRVSCFFGSIFLLTINLVVFSSSFYYYSDIKDFCWTSSNNENDNLIE